ncbi:MAG: class I SAM-dependent methyltransferase [Anaerolineales bacterium]|nr:class I SAM-dependent methyltransferase [Anaerolineales bacterium]
MNTGPMSRLPKPGNKRIAMRVSVPAERALRQGHPWLFDQSIREQSHAGQAGDLAVIFDRKGSFLAIGLYDPEAVIRVRILHRGKPTPIDPGWFNAKLAHAVKLRRSLAALPVDSATTGYRLVNGENDGLPGLVVDRYADILVIKLYSLAWIPYLQDIHSGLKVVCPAAGVILRLSRALARQTAHLHGLWDGIILSGNLPAGPILFQENGLTFETNPVEGQKTGFFLDQRDNRSRVEKLSKGKTVLNLFAYSGAFSVYAARGGARDIFSVDINVPAIESAVRNMAYNQQFPTAAAARHHPITADVFEYLAQLHAQQLLFDMVILDPPMFAQNQDQVLNALSAYQRLTVLGLNVLRPGGVLVQASCSSRIESDVFFNTVIQSASQAGRSLREIVRTGHALDHPVSFKEGAYLKCLFARAS